MSLIEYKNVSIIRQEQTVLKNISLSVQPKDFIFLLGKVGSGKSTFLKSLYCEVPIESGEARVLDYDLCKIKNRHIPYLRRQMGIVFQDFQLLPDRTVEQNLIFVLKATQQCSKKEIPDRVEEVLKYVGMSRKGYRMPHELSGGEQQRIVIARALLNHPKILLADEPTGNLDPQTGEDLMNLFYKISQEGTAVIMSTHNLKWTELVKGRVFNCENGMLLECLSHSPEEQELSVNDN